MHAMIEREIFLRGPRARPPERAPGLPRPRPAAATPACGPRSRRCSRPIEQAGSFLEAPGRGADRRPSTPPGSPEGPGTVIGPYKLMEQIGEGGMGVVYVAEQIAARAPQGRPEGHQAGDGHQAGRRPLRGRAPGPGDDGPPQHRQGPRRRDDRIGPPLLRHGAGAGRAHHRVLRRRAALGPRSGWSCSCSSAAPCSTRTRRGSSTAT